MAGASLETQCAGGALKWSRGLAGEERDGTKGLEEEPSGAQV